MAKSNKEQASRAARQQEEQNDLEQPQEMGLSEVRSNEERLLQDDLHITTPEAMDDTDAIADADEGLGNEPLLPEQEEDKIEIVMGTEADVTEEDLALLGPRDQDMDGGDDEMVLKAGLDDTDMDGDPLNEGKADVDTTGDDLDIPEADLDNPANDAMGQGDEENNYYSLGSDRKDNLTEGTP